MNRGRALNLEPLEARQLLAHAHHQAAHAAAAPVSAPLVIDGALTVVNRSAIMTTNDDGSSTSETPVSGVLGSMGKFQGTWYETVDAYGDYEGPDTIQLHNSKGTILIAFNDQNPVKSGGGSSTQSALERVYSQKVLAGAGAYAKATEAGTIEVVLNPARTGVKTMELQSQNS
jgi:hypothetical protein